MLFLTLLRSLVLSRAKPTALRRGLHSFAALRLVLTPQSVFFYARQLSHRLRWNGVE